MRLLTTLFLLFFSVIAAAQLSPDTAHQATMAELAATEPDTTVIALLIYDGMVLQDFAGPAEVFSKARNLSRGGYEIFTVAPSAAPIKTENGLVTITPTYTVANMPAADYLIVAGGPMPQMQQLRHDSTFIAFLQNWPKKDDAKTVSICTAAYLVGEAGLLDGQRATTHYFVAENFAETFPTVELIKDVRYVDAGAIITASGLTSGIDAALYIVEQLSGERIAAMIARAMQYTPHETEAWPVAPGGMRYRGE